MATRQLSNHEVFQTETPERDEVTRLTVESDIGRGGDVLIGLSDRSSHFGKDLKTVGCVFGARSGRLFQSVSYLI